MNQNSNIKNLVDERFECLALIFRLAGKENYCDLELEYQRLVSEKFSEYNEHPAVKFVKNFDGRESIYLGYHNVLLFIVHIGKKDGKFVFINDISSLFSDNGWNDSIAKDFLPLFNDFYKDTNYEEFFYSQIPIFEEATQKFIGDFYGSVNFEWFNKYIDSSNLRCIYSLSSGNYGATVNNKIIYGCVWKKSGPVIIHEYCHSFANKIAEKWYNEKPEFKEWCDKSVNLEKHPYYGTGKSMAYEYVTTAYEILYFNENEHHGYAGEENFIFYEDEGFPYIRNVYEMVLKI